MLRNKFDKALHRYAKRQQQGLAGASRRQLQRAGQPPHVYHDGRITHSMRTLNTGRYRHHA